MKLYLIRHGETEFNRIGLVQGWLDIPLNENGRKLAIITGEGMKDIVFDAVFTSPLVRASETAKLIIEQGTSNPEWIIEDRLKEIDWGDWDGLGCISSNMEIDNELYTQFYREPLIYPGAPGGESIQAVVERTGEFYKELIHNPQYQDKTIMISTHGCAVRALLHHIYEDKTDFWHGKVPENCCVNIVDVVDGKSTLVGDDVLYYDPSLGNNIYEMR